MRPLYARGGADPRYVVGQSHAGLWYDKFADTWTRRWSMTVDAERSPKLDWLKGVAGVVGRDGLVTELAERQLRLVRARGGCSGVFATTSRFVTGTGRCHPIEIGFTWHPTLGVPYLPGTSVKGMIRAWAEEVELPAARILEAFGPNGPDDGVPRAGRVIVFDAVPVRPPCVEADVLTPHYANWTPADPPGDWRSPNPVAFLTTAIGTELLFAIAGTRAADAELVREIWSWLGAALADRGAGAKTASGYGRFTPAASADQRLGRRLEQRAVEARRAAEQGTPIGRWRARLDGLPESGVIEWVRRNLRKNELTDAAERRAFAEAVLEGPFAAAWRSGKTATPGLPAGSVPGANGLKEHHRLLKAATSTEPPDRVHPP